MRLINKTIAKIEEEKNIWSHSQPAEISELTAKKDILKRGGGDR